MNRRKTIAAVVIGLIFAISFVYGGRISAAETNAAGIINPGSNRIENHTLAKGEKSVTFILDNPNDEACLWIKAHAWDKRKMEHGGGLLRIEVNGVVLEKDRSILQGDTFRYPVHPRSHMKTFYKYDEEKKAWPFKYDLDFIMNSQTGVPGNWSNYTTVDYNHWYAFDLKGIARKGTNTVAIIECNDEGHWKKQFYDGFLIGELGLFSLSEIKGKIEEYNAKQLKMDPKEFVVKVAPIPEGKVPRSEVRDGYIVKDGKPFLHLHSQGYSNIEHGCPNMLFFNWANTVQASGWVVDEVAAYEDYLAPGWEKQDVQTSIALNDTAKTYQADMLSDLYYADFNVNTTIVSPKVAARIPDLYALDSRGKKCAVGDAGGSFPNIGSPLYQEYIQQVVSLMGEKLRNHPGLFVNIAHEELVWRCAATYLPPQDEASKERYREMLREKYKNIETLNREWETTYKGFQDIQPPPTRERSANFINFQIFRSQALESHARNLYQALKKSFPGRLVAGERAGSEWFHGGWGAGENRWLITKWTDIRTIGGEGAVQVRAEARGAGKDIVLQDDICFACQYKYVRRPSSTFWTPPLGKDERGVDITRNSFFNRIIKAYFEGVRSTFFYSYDADRHHLIHNQAKYSKGGVEAKYAAWEIDLSELKGLPDVVVPEHSKQVTAAHGLAYKLAPIMLPAKVDKGKVALLYTRRTSLIGFTFKETLAGKESGGIPQSEWSYLQTLLTHLQVPFEAITEDLIDKELNDYDVLIAGYWATMGNKAMAEKIKAFVEKGGVVIFYPEAFAYNWETTKDNPCSPGYGLDSFFAARIMSKISGKELALKMTEDISPNVKKGDTFKVRGLVTPLEALEGGKVLAALEGTGEPLIISANNDRTYYLGFAVGCSYATSNPDDDKVRGLFEYMLGKSNLKRPVMVKGDKKPYLVYSGVLHGSNYWLLTFLNEFWENQDIKAYLNFLPEGSYELVDITEAGKPLVITPKASSKELLGDGITMSLSPLSGKVLMVREAARKVLVDCPEYELQSIINNQPTDIIVGKNISSSLSALVKEIQDILKEKGIASARILTDDEIPVVDKVTELSEGGFPLGTFRNKVIATDNNLILIGNMENNKLMANLSQKGAYTYDKVLEDVDASYPGEGRGIIQVAESVNKPYFCPTDKSRDAILISGSDEQGTIAALNLFRDILKR